VSHDGNTIRALIWVEQRFSAAIKRAVGAGFSRCGTSGAEAHFARQQLYAGLKACSTLLKDSPLDGHL
jgi:hypothetical protein